KKRMRGRSELLAFCHGDLNPSNILITKDGDVFVVDWESASLAPPETDIAFLTATSNRLWRSGRPLRAFVRSYQKHAATLSRTLDVYRELDDLERDINRASWRRAMRRRLGGSAGEPQ